MTSSVTIIGGGKLSQPVAEFFQQQYPVTVLKRTPPNSTGEQNDSPAAHIQEIGYRAADITDIDSIRFSLPTETTHLLYCLTPPAFTEEAYQQVFPEGLRNLHQVLTERGQTLERLFFVSSSGVYHQDNDTVVDESSEIAPTSFSGIALKSAEAFIKDHFTSTIIRFSGIYGGNRTRLLNQALQGELPEVPHNPFTNRIHERDCIGVLQHLMAKSLAGETLENLYLATDCEPVRINTMRAWFKAHLECAPDQPATEPFRRRNGSKQCRNSRLLSSGYDFIYPNWRSGYREMIERLMPEKIAEPFF
ncbi:nucleoside-diphosphate-sugar epimerase [Oleiphilus messinensis]|uniref:Nucleoside-diphosphate-sugar epimerase n=1 Tax=Oleiphilus messinensis TaxID=141451 RepID=A0A1Y0I4P1_9GAMM|nr:hypothetical protein [Oleiphilus messinensis]ARU55442.1 nucleoside-diphosphate-sugar epimerase [Oleiphilus messinensis]